MNSISISSSGNALQGSKTASGQSGHTAKAVAGLFGLALSAGVSATTLPAKDHLAGNPWIQLKMSAALDEADISSQIGKKVDEEGVGPEEFAKTAFGKPDWRGLLVSQKGEILLDEGKLRLGEIYFQAHTREHAKLLSEAFRKMKAPVALSKKKEAYIPPKLTHEEFQKIHTEKTVKNSFLESYDSARKKFQTFNPEHLISFAKMFRGTPYKLGGDGTYNIDCSRLVLNAMKMGGVVPKDYNNNAAGLYHLTQKKDPHNVKPGDLLFFRNDTGKIGHVAIALSGRKSNGTVDSIDASSKTGKVSERSFAIWSHMLVGTPNFYGKPSVQAQIQIPEKFTSGVKLASSDIQAEMPNLKSEMPAEVRVVEKTSAKTIKILAANDPSFSPTIQKKLASNNIDAQIEHYKKQQANGVSGAGEAVRKLSLVKLHTIVALLKDAANDPKISDARRTEVQKASRNLLTKIAALSGKPAANDQEYRIAA